MDLDAGGPARRFPAPGGYPFDVAVRPDAVEIAVAGADGAVRPLDPGTGTVGAELVGHAPYPVSLAYGPDAETLVSAGMDGTVRVWDAVALTPGRWCARTAAGRSAWTSTPVGS